MLHLIRHMLTLVERHTNQVEEPAKICFSHGHCDRFTCIYYFPPARETIRGVHGHRPHLAIAKMLLDFCDQGDLTLIGLYIHLPVSYTHLRAHETKANL